MWGMLAFISFHFIYFYFTGNEGFVRTLNTRGICLQDGSQSEWKFKQNINAVTWRA